MTQVTPTPYQDLLRQAHGDGRVEVSAVDPAASMQAVENPALADIALKVQGLLKATIAQL